MLAVAIKAFPVTDTVRRALQRFQESWRYYIAGTPHRYEIVDSMSEASHIVLAGELSEALDGHLSLHARVRAKTLVPWKYLQDRNHCCKPVSFVGLKERDRRITLCLTFSDAFKDKHKSCMAELRELYLLQRDHKFKVPHLRYVLEFVTGDPESVTAHLKSCNTPQAVSKFRWLVVKDEVESHCVVVAAALSRTPKKSRALVATMSEFIHTPGRVESVV